MSGFWGSWERGRAVTVTRCHGLSVISTRTQQDALGHTWPLLCPDTSFSLEGHQLKRFFAAAALASAVVLGVGSPAMAMVGGADDYTAPARDMVTTLPVGGQNGQDGQDDAGKCPPANSDPDLVVDLGKLACGTLDLAPGNTDPSTLLPL